ncbi:MAG: VOC family protein [Planctomycetes bacterium]|nr:VOC family protein [Planctomycetota bacterium]
MPVHFQPENYHSITPYIIIKGAADAIAFYKKVFGAEDILRIPGPGGCVAHAEIKIGDSILMLADEMSEMGYKGPGLTGTPVALLLYVKNVDAVFGAAVAAGAKVTKPVKDQFYGDRMGSFNDPFGHSWHVATHVEDVSPEECAKRAAQQCG